MILILALRKGGAVPYLTAIYRHSAIKGLPAVPHLSPSLSDCLNSANVLIFWNLAPSFNEEFSGGKYTRD